MTKINETTYGQITNLYSANNRTFRVALRIVRENGVYRVDYTSGFGPFVAIDNGNGYETLAEAKKCVTAYKRAARAQRTYTPRNYL